MLINILKYWIYVLQFGGGGAKGVQIKPLVPSFPDNGPHTAYRMGNGIIVNSFTMELAII
jgi:hypothetical protein